MGRPVNPRYINQSEAAHTDLSGETAGNEKILGICKIGSNAADEYTILAQKGSNKFLVRDNAGNVGTCVLVNKPEQAGSESTNPALGADEMIMNCKNAAGVHRVMKLMNRTLYYQKDGETTNNLAGWGFGAAADATSSSIEVVQLEELEIAGTGSEFKSD